MEGIDSDMDMSRIHIAGSMSRSFQNVFYTHKRCLRLYRGTCTLLELYSAFRATTIFVILPAAWTSRFLWFTGLLGRAGMTAWRTAFAESGRSDMIAPWFGWEWALFRNQLILWLPKLVPVCLRPHHVFISEGWLSPTSVDGRGAQ